MDHVTILTVKTLNSVVAAYITSNADIFIAVITETSPASIFDVHVHDNNYLK